MHFESLATIRFPFYLLFLFTAWNASSMTLSNVLELLLLRKKNMSAFLFVQFGFFKGRGFLGERKSIIPFYADPDCPECLMLCFTWL